MNRLLVTDLDGTFLGDDEASTRLWDRIEEAAIGMVFSSGRHIASIEDLYERWGTDRRATACICMVGTEVWWREGDEYVRDEKWDHRLSVGWDHAAVSVSLVGVPRLHPQPDEWQSPHKMSFFVPSHVEADAVRETLVDAGHRVRVIWSADRYLDIVPEAAGKGNAMLHVIETLGVSPARVAVAGDTGNDIDMMVADLGVNAIVVGNASRELVAFSGAHVYHARADHASGVAEGLEHLGWI